MTAFLLEILPLIHGGHVPDGSRSTDIRLFGAEHCCPIGVFMPNIWAAPLKTD